MLPRRQRQFVYGQAGWMLGTIVTLTLLDALTLERFFVLSLVGFLIVVELTAPRYLTLPWRARLQWITAAGLVVFAVLAVRRLLLLVPPEALFS